MSKILIIDDQASNRQFITDLLHYAGHRTFEASDGAAGLALAQAERPDLVISDVVMPNMDGYEFVRQLRGDPNISATPVIFCTATYHEFEVRALGTACGVLQIVTKPVEPDVLLRAVNSALEAKRTAAVVPSPAFHQEHLRLITDKLHQKVQELEAVNLQLTVKNEELIAAAESARQANLVKSRFLANMSHELRTPLNGVIGLSEILQDDLVGELNPQQKEYIGDILASGRHLLDLVNNLLDLERVELGKMEFSPQRVNLEQLLVEVRDVLRAIAAANCITVSISVDADLHMVYTDPIRLRQVFYNYLSNAIKFSPPDTMVQVRAAINDGATFRLEVEDEGPGLKPEELSSMFADFHQLDRTQKRAGQGAGLGLALTKRIVEAQGGSVGIQSTFGSGSLFYAVLPMEHRAVKQPESRTPLAAISIT